MSPSLRGGRAPWGSVILPSTVPVCVCASATAGTSEVASSNASNRFVRRLMALTLFLSWRVDAIVLRGVDRVTCSGTRRLPGPAIPAGVLKNAGDCLAGLDGCSDRRATVVVGRGGATSRVRTSVRAFRSGVFEGTIASPAAADHGISATTTAPRTRLARVPRCKLPRFPKFILLISRPTLKCNHRALEVCLRPFERDTGSTNARTNPA